MLRSYFWMHEYDYMFTLPLLTTIISYDCQISSSMSTYAICLPQYSNSQWYWYCHLLCKFCMLTYVCQFKRLHKNKYTTRKVMIWPIDGYDIRTNRHEKSWRKACRFCTTLKNVFNDCSLRFAQNDLIIAQMWSYESFIITCIAPLTLGCFSLITHHTESLSYESVSVLSYCMF